MDELQNDTRQHRFITYSPLPIIMASFCTKNIYRRYKILLDEENSMLVTAWEGDPKDACSIP